eukprot:3640743-Karenia_brevis.AAC.1
MCIRDSPPSGRRGTSPSGAYASSDDSSSDDGRSRSRKRREQDEKERAEIAGSCRKLDEMGFRSKPKPTAGIGAGEGNVAAVAGDGLAPSG